MSDTKIQINNNKNQATINHLKRLYREERSLRLELKYVQNMIREKRPYVNFGTFHNYDTSICLTIIKGTLLINKSMIKMVSSDLVIC